MGRPKMKASKRRVQANISVHPEIAELARKTDNQSKFYESSVEAARGLSMIIKKLENKEIEINDAIEELSDIAAVWDNNFEDMIPFVPSAKQDKAVG
jgi:hypothetical protein